MDAQSNTFLSKLVSGDADLITLFLKIRVGEGNMEGLRASNQLYGAVFGLFRLVNGRNDGKCLLFCLAAKIPATEVVAHMGTSQDSLEDIIPIMVNSLYEKGGNHERTKKHSLQ